MSMGMPRSGLSKSGEHVGPSFYRPRPTLVGEEGRPCAPRGATKQIVDPAAGGWPSAFGVSCVRKKLRLVRSFAGWRVLARRCAGGPIWCDGVEPPGVGPPCRPAPLASATWANRGGGPFEAVGRGGISTCTCFASAQRPPASGRRATGFGVHKNDGVPRPWEEKKRRPTRSWARFAPYFTGHGHEPDSRVRLTTAVTLDAFNALRAPRGAFDARPPRPGPLSFNAGSFGIWVLRGSSGRPRLFEAGT